MAHAGVGSITHFTCLLLNSTLGVKPTMVPFNGGAPALNALVGSQVDYMCDTIPNIVQQVQSGAIKAYAIGTTERNPALPNVPTSKEAGLPEFQASAWSALFAPKGTPKPILDKLTEAAQAFARPRMRHSEQDKARPRSRRRAPYQVCGGGCVGDGRLVGASPLSGSFVGVELPPSVSVLSSCRPSVGNICGRIVVFFPELEPRNSPEPGSSRISASDIFDWRQGTAPVGVQHALRHEMRRRDLRYIDLAKRFGVSPSQFENILDGSCETNPNVASQIRRFLIEGAKTVGLSSW
jgi:Tripartite tricarboxylate transporter family receptor